MRVLILTMFLLGCNGTQPAKQPTDGAPTWTPQWGLDFCVKYPKDRACD